MKLKSQNSKVKTTTQNSKLFTFEFWFYLFTFTFLLSVICHFSYAQDFTYSSKGKRDPFVPLVGVGAVYETKEAVEINSLEDVALEGIVYDEKGGSRAIINSMILKEGDKAGAMTIEKIEPKKVTLQIGEEKHELILSDEKGGEAR